MERKVKKKFLLVIVWLFCTALANAETLTWKDCVDETIKNNSELKSAAEKVTETKAQGWSSFASALPQISAYGSGSRNGQDLTTQSNIGGVDYTTLGTTHTDSYSYGLTGRQLIFDGFSTLHLMLSASESSKAAEENYKSSSASVRQELVQAFAALLSAQALEQITSDIQDLRKSQLNDIKLRYQSGTEHKGNFMNTEASYDQAVYSKNQADRALEIAKSQLCFVLGRDKKADITVTGDFAVAEDINTEPDFDALYKNDPAMLALIAQKNSADYSSRAAYGSFFPSVYASASAGRADDKWPPGENNKIWSVGVNVTLPLFEGGALVAKAVQAHAAAVQAEADEKTGRDQIIQSLMQSWKSLKDAYEFSGVQKEFLDATAERAKIADVQYATGLTTFNDWTIIQDALVSSKTSYLNAQTNLLTTEAAWIQAKGGTLEDEKK
jgi:outer membrane protein TolC